MGSGDRVALASLFIAVNSIYLLISSYQLSRQIFHKASLSKYNNNPIFCTIRYLNTITSLLFVILAVIDTDFWIFDLESINTAPDSIYMISIPMKACIDISLCITGCMLIVQLMNRYFQMELGDDVPVPKILTMFWRGIAISFAVLVIGCLLIAFIGGEWRFVRVYADIRLIYLFVASTKLSYTYYWVFYKADETAKQQLIRAILLLLFAIASLVVGILTLVETVVTNTWSLKDVVSTGLHGDDADAHIEFLPFLRLLVSWAGYWFVMGWYLKIVWIARNESEDARKMSQAVEDDGAEDNKPTDVDL